MRAVRILMPAVAAGLLLAGCGGTEAAPPEDASGVPPAAGSCLAGDTECVDDLGPAGGPVDDEFPSDQAKADAEALLGAREDELPEDVRVSRRGDETLFLTEDYRIGRMTVELDERDGVFVVTSVVVELPEGPVTFDG